MSKRSLVSCTALHVGVVGRLYVLKVADPSRFFSWRKPKVIQCFKLSHALCLEQQIGPKMSKANHKHWGVLPIANCPLEPSRAKDSNGPSMQHLVWFYVFLYLSINSYSVYKITAPTGVISLYDTTELTKASWVKVTGRAAPQCWWVHRLRCRTGWDQRTQRSRPAAKAGRKDAPEIKRIWKKKQLN